MAIESRGSLPRIQPLQQLGSGCGEGGVYDGRRDLSERFEDKSSLVHPWMWHIEAGFVDFLFTKQQKIQVDGARPPFLTPLAAEVALYFQKVRQQIPWRKGGLKTSGSIEKRRRITRPAHRRVFIKRREPQLKNARYFC